MQTWGRRYCQTETENESLHEISKDNGVTVVNSVT
jgi:hypothetical protein